MAGTVRHVIEFIREELLYDIKNVAFVAGDVMQTEDDHQKHQVIDIGEDGNVDRVTRIMNLAFAEVVEWLVKYTKLELRKNGNPCCIHPGGWQSDEFEEPDEYMLVMLVPDTCSYTTLSLLKELIHEYVICRVLEDWFSITNKDEAETWRLKREEAAAGIQHYRSMGRKSRLRLHPW